MTYQDNAKGLRFAGDHEITPEEIADVDFVVCEIGDKFTKNIQTAYNHGKLFFMFVPHMLEDRHVNYGPGESNWPVDTDPLIKVLDRYVQSGGANRVIHGIIVDNSETKDEYGNPFTTWWIVKHCDFILDKIYERYGILVYMYMNNAPWNAAKNDTDRQLLISHMVKWGICVRDPATIEGDIPVAAERPHPPYDDLSSIQWYLWLYYVKSTDPIWKWLYNGTVKKMYEDHNLEIGEAPGDVPTIPGEVPVIPGDIPGVSDEKIDEVILLLHEIVDLLLGIREKFA